MGWLLIASGWLDLAMWIAVLKVAIGLGFVIFVHELGHFLVAKACGVKCEKFYLGFDIGGIKLARFTWGETEYGIGILPLGGYVKMLGQEDNPARIREEIERAKEAAAAEQGDAGPLGDEPDQQAEGSQPSADDAAEGSGDTDTALAKEQAERLREAEAALYDPRSYLAKSVPQRMAIISAGVIMNLIFAFVMAVVAFGMGVRQIASGVGQLLPGEAAWQVGMRVGDDIIEVDGQKIEKFRDMQEAISLGDNLSEGKKITVRRPGRAEPLEFNVLPDSSGLLPRIGIFSSHTTTLSRDKTPVFPGSAASNAEPAVEGGDKIVAVNGQTVSSYAELQGQLALNPDQPLKVDIERPNGEGGDEADAETPDSRRTTVSVPVGHMRRLGLVMEMGEIAAVQDGSPAAAAGIEPGDVIRRIDVDLPTAPGAAGNPESPGDPMTFPQRLRKYAGRRVKLFVERDGQEELQPIVVTLRSAPWLEPPVGDGSPMTAPVLGIAYRVLNRVHAPIAGSPAAQAGIEAGDEVIAARILPPKKTPGEDAVFDQQEAQLQFDAKNRNWPSFLFALQQTLPGTTVELTWQKHNHQEQVQTIEPYNDDAWFNPDRGFLLEPRYIVEKGDSFGEAVALGWHETVKSTLLVYRFLQKLSTQQVSPRALGGPVSIFIVAKREAGKGTAELLVFLTLLSANLAVINFLPIPLLDGGHMVLLAYEGIRGKPADERVQIVLTYIGLIFILGLMLWVLSLDFGWIPRQ